MSEPTRRNGVIESGLRQTPRIYFRFVLTDPATTWFKLSMTVVGAYLISLSFPTNNLLSMYTRAITGAVILLLLPGLATQQLLSAGRSLHVVETVAFSIGLSVIITTFLSAIVNFSPAGLATTPIISTLILYTVSVSTFATFKEFQCLHTNTL
ncbi:MAG: DUF1616 domain-containing protein [Thaumarchaeota archaeon]|nr:DUF1616 domain-containing protein [Nitrososphaerota archaeon]MCL5317489.1 DUF1616 domain-containing protein [Nitrososphaerota archaeon]